MHKKALKANKIYYILIKLTLKYLFYFSELDNFFLL